MDLIQLIEGENYSRVLRRALCNEGDIVDVGCYMWDWSRKFIGNRRVIGVDPIENNLPNGCEIFKGVLGNTNSIVNLELNGVASKITNDKVNESILQVEMITWKLFCQKFNIDKISVLKINIEGGEYDLLKSMDYEDFEKIDQIAVSFHHWLNPSWEKLTNESLSLLQNFGFEIVNIYDDCKWYLAYKNNL